MTENIVNAQNWQQILQNAWTNVGEFCAYLDLPHADSAKIIQACTDFPFIVPHPYAERIQKRNARDPLLLQVLPRAEESKTTPGFSHDPLNESQYNPLPGLLHKYQSRALITLTGRCAVNCRYCFRRHFPYRDNNPGSAGREKIIAYLQQQLLINEVIFSGGDPLVVSDKLLHEWCEAIASIPHIDTLRIHTRLPIMIPNRVTTSLLNIFTKTRLRVVMVLHSNHAQELDHSVLQACQQLQDGGVTLLNQSVLLANINDDAQTLAALSRRLWQIGVLPYYLHCLDATLGTQHFQVDVQRTQDIMQDLRDSLPGYLVPRCVREVPGAKSKIPLELLNSSCPY